MTRYTVRNRLLLACCAVFGLLLSWSLASPSTAGEQQILGWDLFWRVCEGDATGSEKDGTLKVIDSALLQPGAGYGQPHAVVVARHGDPAPRVIPGERPRDAPSYQREGVHLELTPYSASETHLSADMRLELRVFDEAPADLVATRGEVYCIAGKFPFNEKIRMDLKPGHGGAPRWVELYFEKSKFELTNSLTVGGKQDDVPPARARSWMPNWLRKVAHRPK